MWQENILLWDTHLFMLSLSTWRVSSVEKISCVRSCYQPMESSSTSATQNWIEPALDKPSCLTAVWVILWASLSLGAAGMPPRGAHQIQHAVHALSLTLTIARWQPIEEMTIFLSEEINFLNWIHQERIRACNFTN